MPVLETIHVNAVSFVLSELEQLGEVQMCQNIWSMRQILKQQCKPAAADYAINVNQTKEKGKITHCLTLIRIIYI